MWIAREIRALIEARAATRPVLVITGARQTGKTSLARRLFPDHNFVTLDLPSEAAQASLQPETFFARHPPPVVIDEVQYAPEVLRHLKVLVDAHRDEQRNGQFVLTGSQKPHLMRSVSESLAGRADLLELEGLSWHEVAASPAAWSLDEAVLRGGFPELIAKPEIDATGFFRSYVATYLERDLRQHLNVSSLLSFERFLRACALRTGQVLNRAELARDVGVTAPTAAEWLNVLVAANQVVLLEPWYSNRTKSLVKAAKIYLNDAGLAAFLCGVRSVEELRRPSPLAGALWETFVFGEIRRRQLAATGSWTLHYWRDRTKEADFLLHRGGRFVLADAKWNEQPDRHDAARLAKIATDLPRGSVTQQLIVCRTPNAFPLDATTHAVPVSELGGLV